MVRERDCVHSVRAQAGKKRNVSWARLRGGQEGNVTRKTMLIRQICKRQQGTRKEVRAHWRSDVFIEAFGCHAKTYHAKPLRLFPTGLACPPAGHCMLKEFKKEEKIREEKKTSTSNILGFGFLEWEKPNIMIDKM